MQPKQTFERHGYRGLYLERSGESAAELVDVLMRPPEMPLDPEEKQQAYAFERSLADYELHDGKTIEQMVCSADGEDRVAPFVFPEYIVNGTVNLEEYHAPEFETHDQVCMWFAGMVRDKQILPTELLKIAKQTNDAYKKEVEEALLSDQDVAPAALSVRSFVIDPDKVLSLGRGANEARRMLLDLRREYTESSDVKLDRAKRAIVDTYLARVDSVIADNIPIADYLIQQSNDIGDYEMSERAEQTIPPSLVQALRRPEVRADVFLRLDYLRNGIGLDDDGRATAVANAVIDAARPETVNESEETVFTPAQAEILRRTELPPDEIQRIFSRIIQKAGLLSSEDASTWTPDRRTRASDGKIQVVIDPVKNTFSVDGVSGTYRVPSVPNSLYRVLTVGGFHELQHISQAQADRQLGETLRIGGRMKGKRPSMIREGGANAAQRKAELRLFGRAKPIALTYAQALETLRDGGSLLDASRAFFDVKRRVMPEVSAQKAAEESSDRVLRLIRRGGYNSQAMSYAEEGILADELLASPPGARARAMAVTSLDLVDQVRLHKYGLLPDSLPEFPDWSAFVLEELAPYIDEALDR